MDIEWMPTAIFYDGSAKKLDWNIPVRQNDAIVDALIDILLATVICDIHILYNTCMLR